MVPTYEQFYLLLPVMQPFINLVIMVGGIAVTLRLAIGLAYALGWEGYDTNSNDPVEKLGAGEYVDGQGYGFDAYQYEKETQKQIVKRCSGCGARGHEGEHCSYCGELI